MKFMHLSDLHIGKWVNGYLMLEDQKYIFRQICRIADLEKPDAVIIAGDIYDKQVPSAQAVECFDDFLAELFAGKMQVFLISGNHDSPERLKYGSRLMDQNGIHISTVYKEPVLPCVMEDEYGPLFVYMLPFLKPSDVRRFCSPEEDAQGDEEPAREDLPVTYHDALLRAVRAMNIDTSKRNVIIAHQFVTGSIRSDSEEISVGGLDQVDADVFRAFDYTALGHIHRPQNIGSDRIRYCGSPLKYSFSESRYEKSVTIVELKEKGTTDVRQIPLIPLHDMTELKGTYDELVKKSFYENTSWQEDYVHITLTDEEDVLNAAARLQTIYHNLMKLDYDNARTRADSGPELFQDMEEKSPLELFTRFYEQQNAVQLTDEQTDYLKGLIESIWKEHV